jgi:hypothetical protein
MMWHCPHCGTPQAEASRCWVCKRSSTSCGTCRHFRRAIAGQLGYCGLDRDRLPLRGDELRGCWQAAPDAPAHAAPSHPATRPGSASLERPRLDFVPLDPPAATAVAPPAMASPVSPPRTTVDPLLGFWAEEG